MLTRRVLRGLGMSFVCQATNRLGTFLTGIVLARLLVPEEFGVFAVALIAVSLLGAINELGVMPSLVKWRGEGRDIAEAERTGMTMSLGMSLLLYGGVFLAAPWFASTLGSPSSAGILRVMALALVVDGYVAVPHARLRADLLQGRQAIAEIAGMLAYASVAVGIALAGGGPWSLGVGHVAAVATAGGLITLFARPFTRPAFDPRIAGAILTFGGPLIISHLLWEAVLNLDYLIIGPILGTASLGLYLLAFNLSSWPVSIVSMSIERVSMPSFARVVGDRDRLPHVVARAFGLTLGAVAPLVAVLALLSSDVVGFLYGGKWAGAVPALRFLLVLGGVRVLMDLFTELLAADGRSGVSLTLRTVWVATLLPAMIVGARTGGIAGVAGAHVTVAVLVAVPLILVIGRRSGIDPRLLARELPRPAFGVMAMVVATLGASPLVAGAPHLLRLVTLGPLAVIAYGLVYLPANHHVRWTLNQFRSPAAETV